MVAIKGAVKLALKFVGKDRIFQIFDDIMQKAVDSTSTSVDNKIYEQMKPLIKEYLDKIL